MADLENRVLRELAGGRLSATELSRRLEVPLPDIMATLRNSKDVRWLLKADLEAKMIREFNSGCPLDAAELSRRLKIPLPDILLVLRSALDERLAMEASFGFRVRHALARWAAHRKAARLRRKPANSWVAAPAAAFVVAAYWGLVKDPFLVGIALTAAAVVGYGIWVICAAWLRRLHR